MMGRFRSGPGTGRRMLNELAQEVFSGLAHGRRAQGSGRMIVLFGVGHGNAMRGTVGIADQIRQQALADGAALDVQLDDLDHGGAELIRQQLVELFRSRAWTHLCPSFASSSVFSNLAISS